jgi:hypothetical protein
MKTKDTLGFCHYNIGHYLTVNIFYL